MKCVRPGRGFLEMTFAMTFEVTPEIKSAAKLPARHRGKTHGAIYADPGCCDSRLPGCLAGFEQTRSTHATTNTHADNAVFLLPTFQLANDMAGQPRPCHTKGVADGD